MAFDEAQAARLRRVLSGLTAITEKRMFGGICFMLRDHMLCGTGWNGFMFRVGEEGEAIALARPGARLMEMRARKMHGFVWVDPAQCQDLPNWVALAQAYVETLPPKKAARRRSAAKPGRKPAKRASAAVS